MWGKITSQVHRKYSVAVPTSPHTTHLQRCHVIWFKGLILGSLLSVYWSFGKNLYSWSLEI